jgi:hypothetical protein
MLFSTPMVKAIVEDRKTQTRRSKGLIINDQPDNYFLDPLNKEKGVYIFSNKEMTQGYFPTSPYNVGDVLWVRETFRPIEQDCGKPRYEYKSTEKINLLDKWKPSIFMPKEACRIFLEVIDIRVERLKEITVWDAEAEGVEVRYIDGDEEFKNYLSKGVTEDEPWGDSYFANNPVLSFMSLWQSLNGLESWDLNPWVWVIKFARIEKPIDFI